MELILDLQDDLGCLEVRMEHLTLALERTKIIFYACIADLDWLHIASIEATVIYRVSFVTWLLVSEAGDLRHVAMRALTINLVALIHESSWICFIIDLKS